FHSSYHSISHFQTAIFPQKLEPSTKQTFFVPYKRVNKKASTTSNFGWVISQGDSLLKHSFNERLEQLLAVTPSEYVRKDKERKNREAGLRSCIQSLTSLLERALTNTTDVDLKLSKDAIKKSLNVIRENIEGHLSNMDLDDYATSSLHSIIENSTNRHSLRNNLPQLLDVDSSDSVEDNRYHEEEKKERKCDDSLQNLCWKKSDLCELYMDSKSHKSVATSINIAPCRCKTFGFIKACQIYSVSTEQGQTRPEIIETLQEREIDE
ncbi:hypothetical protein NQ317_010472, partial [Molorchus minor]